MGGGTKGNAAHTTGRHRSLEWCLRSVFCTDRSYGTRDARDLTGVHRHIRAVDLKLNPTQMREVSHRLNDAVRAGDAPMVAEWFGTFNNTTVVGWFEGHASSSDSSHLTHVHVGVWTKYADDPAALDRLFAIMTGEDMPTVSEIWNTDGMIANQGGVGGETVQASTGLERAWKAAQDAENLGQQNKAGLLAVRADLTEVKQAVARIEAALAAAGLTGGTLKFEGTATTVPKV
jgi:hypothetical protein